MAQGVCEQAQERQKIKEEFYGKLAEWGERAALALFVSLVIQNLVEGASTLFMIGATITTGVVYWLSYNWLKKSKPF